MTSANNPQNKKIAGKTTGQILRDYGMIIIILVAAIIFAIFEPNFVSVENMVGILYQVAIIGVMAVCTTFVIITGGIDLSVGPMMAVSGLLAFFVMQATNQSIVPAIIIGVTASAIAGTVNGLAIAWLKLPPFVVTLGMMSIVRGVALLYGEASLHIISGPDSYLFIGSGRILGIPFPVFIFLFMAAVMWFIQTQTRFGLTVFGLGQNEEATRLCGLPVILSRTLVYTISGLGAGIAGIILSSQVHTASSVYGNGAELDVIASIVVGGTSLTGGKGSVFRSVLGALLIGMITNGLSILNFSIQIQLIAKGIIIVLALAADGWFQSERVHTWFGFSKKAV